MRVYTFAAIDIDSYQLVLKIYEIVGSARGASAKGGKLKVVDCVRYRMDLGRDAYAVGRISHEKVSALCEQLLRFKKIMAGYKVDDYRICTTSAIREVENAKLVLDQIKTSTGMRVEVLSNSEQRFLEYKALATREEDFNNMIQKKTAVADIGGGSLQISLFNQDRLVATQNMRLGAVRIREQLEDSRYRSTNYVEMINELVEKQLEAFDYLYLSGTQIYNIIVVGEISVLLINGCGGAEEFVPAGTFLDFYDRMMKKPPEKIVAELDISPDYAQFVYPIMVILKNIVERTGAKELWAPGVHLCDGMAYHYAVEKKLLKETHDFVEDIRAAADNIARRYMCNLNHTKQIGEYAVTIFDATKKMHGMGRRERLLLEMIAMLHDCGNYISLTHAPQSSYNIIMSTEIIGLSHLEREIVANTIQYATLEAAKQEELLHKLGEKAYLTVYKLSAIQKLANALDRSHHQKIQKLKAVMKDGELLITAESKEDVTLESRLFHERAEFFEEVFCVRPQLKVRSRTAE